MTKVTVSLRLPSGGLSIKHLSVATEKMRVQSLRLYSVDTGCREGYNQALRASELEILEQGPL